MLPPQRRWTPTSSNRAVIPANEGFGPSQRKTAPANDRRAAKSPSNVLTDPCQSGILRDSPADRGSMPFRGLSKVIVHMLPARRFAAATALSLIASGFFTLLFSAWGSAAEAASGSCPDAAELTVLPSPIAPWKGVTLRFMVVV